MTGDEMRRMLTIAGFSMQSAADELGVTVQTVHRHIKSKRVPKTFEFATRYICKQDDADNELAQRLVRVMKEVIANG